MYICQMSKVVLLIMISLEISIDQKGGNNYYT